MFELVVEKTEKMLLVVRKAIKIKESNITYSVMS